MSNDPPTITADEYYECIKVAAAKVAPQWPGIFDAVNAVYQLGYSRGMAAAQEGK